MGEMLRTAWEVTAGIIPGKAMPEHTKRWFCTSDEYETNPEIIIKKRDEAYEYAKSLHDPRYLNWIRVDWIWY